MVLRSILVLDRTYTQVKDTSIDWSYTQTFQYFFQKAAATRFARQKTLKPAKQSESLKRRVGYFEEELGATKAKLDNMQVDESHREKD